MKDVETAKSRIVDATIQLIKESGGRPKSVTIRAICQRADVGTGLINYHFGSKERLITNCVQKIITGVVTGFVPKLEGTETECEKLTRTAQQVFEFLFSNPEISRISILGDFEDFRPDTNSVMTQQGFIHSLGRDDKRNRRVALLVTLAIQAGFLGAKHSKALFGLDFSLAEDRKRFVKETVDLIMKGEKSYEKKL